MKILWLASWYPSELKPYNGDFIQRHAKAASHFNDIHVIHVIKDNLGSITKSKKIVTYKEGRLTEDVIYYYSPFSGVLGKAISEWRYRSIFKKAVNDYVEKNGKPKLIHVHIAMKAGLIAQWISKKYNVRYLLTEHWTGLLQESKPSLKNYPIYYQNRYRKIINKAISISTVSKYLEQEIKLISKCRHSIIIPNVVDTKIFKPLLKEIYDIPKFIHISNLNYQKNFDKVVEAFKILKDDGQLFQLIIIGPHITSLKQKIVALGLDKEMSFLNEMPQLKLSALINKSDALILFSRYETFGCVVIEANACGVPVIVSDIPAMQEIVREGINGMLAKNDDAISLASTIKNFIIHKNKFNKFEIASQTQTLYSYYRIGEMFDNWYKWTQNN